MAELETVITVDDTSGRLHKRYRTASGELASLEGDNLDQAGDWHTADPSEVSEASPDAFCRNCFPEVAAEGREPSPGQ